MEDDEATLRVLEESRFWVQKVFVPLVVCIGVVGNTITVMVLTRRKMRSSTNTYLSALAIADIVHLLFVLVLSFKHYANIHDRKYELYWRFYGITHWICDAASSTSVWLTVSFTIERYVAVCHPMRGRAFCTENRAKTVIVIVYIFCLITTASTTFEYQLTLNDTCVECGSEAGGGQVGNGSTGSTMVGVEITPTPKEKRVERSVQQVQVVNHQQAPKQLFNDPQLQSKLRHLLANCSGDHPHIIYVYPRESGGHIVEDVNASELLPFTYNKASSDTTIQQQTDSNEHDNVTSTACCGRHFRIDVEETELGANATYSEFVSWYSALVFGLVPLSLIATFNCFLVCAVYKSTKKRKQLTNVQETTTISSENRITIMLIGVVVMFLLCQTPTAIFLIYKTLHGPDPEPRNRNINLILGNFFNLLVTINGTFNFVLYSLLSKKFRATFKEIFFERKRRIQDAFPLTSTKSVNSQKFNPHKHGVMRRNMTEYRTPRNLETQSLTAVPRSRSLMSRPLGKAKSSDLIV